VSKRILDFFFKENTGDFCCLADYGTRLKRCNYTHRFSVFSLFLMRYAARFQKRIGGKHPEFFSMLSM
jgi:hypothetical protein